MEHHFAKQVNFIALQLLVRVTFVRLPPVPLLMVFVPIQLLVGVDQTIAMRVRQVCGVLNRLIFVEKHVEQVHIVILVQMVPVLSAVKADGKVLMGYKKTAKKRVVLEDILKQLD